MHSSNFMTIKVWYMMLRSRQVNSKMVNLKHHLIRTHFFQLFAWLLSFWDYNIRLIRIRSQTLPTNDFEFTVSSHVTLFLVITHCLVSICVYVRSEANSLVLYKVIYLRSECELTKIAAMETLQTRFWKFWFCYELYNTGLTRLIRTWLIRTFT